jgi:hypothetical protein
MLVQEIRTPLLKDPEQKATSSRPTAKKELQQLRNNKLVFIGEFQTLIFNEFCTFSLRYSPIPTSFPWVAEVF